jgi:hypothetical protein
VRACNLAWHTVAAMSATFLLLAIMAWGFNFLFWHVWLWFGGFQAVALSCLKIQTVVAEPNETIVVDVQPTNLQRAFDLTSQP